MNLETVFGIKPEDRLLIQRLSLQSSTVIMYVPEDTKSKRVFIMNIKEAKQEIKDAVVAYFSKNEFDEYEIPIEKQRPVFLMGPPGIGKTAIMAQIAAELDVGLVSYSMTHHTRQSAIGLPFIEKKEYGSTEYSVSEYTMSEIIASVYDMMKETGHKEGILFLDEVNCVSETLAPAMLQFLQFKIFGRHRVPDGWIIVTAGNPPEYNNSVREFDIVTWDRLKRIDVEPDHDVWKEYAYMKNTHPAVMTYLEIRKNDFYKIETSVKGKSFVTARGWSDLSDIMKLYEKKNIEIRERLMLQYLQNEKIAKNFAIYYDLFNKYKADYQVEAILSGNTPDEVRERAVNAKFDERLSLLGLLIDGAMESLQEVCRTEFGIAELFDSLKTIKTELETNATDPFSAVDAQIKAKTDIFEKGKKSSSLSDDRKYALHSAVSALEEERKLLAAADTDGISAAFDLIRNDFNERKAKLRVKADEACDMLEALFEFCEDVFEEGQEILILVTELTISYYGAHFISVYGCRKYFEHNDELLFYERQKEIISEIEKLEIQDVGKKFGF